MNISDLAVIGALLGVLNFLVISGILAWLLWREDGNGRHHKKGK